MEILERNSQHFANYGMILAFSTFVDFEANRKYNTQPESSPASLARTTDTQHIFTRMKRSLKGPIVNRPFFAFLLFLSTLGARGLVTALKARLHDRPGCVHFYQDFLTAFFGCFLHHTTARRVLILHSSTDSLRHLFIHFPGMTGTRYEKLIRRCFEWTLRQQKTIVALSEKYAEELRIRYRSQEVICIYNTSPFSGARTLEGALVGAQSQIRLIAVGTLQYIKGFDLLINAIALMPRSEREKLAVTIVGGGPCYAELAELVNRHQLAHVITLAGESNDVAAFLQKSDVFILTSRDEGLPISLIEACSFGLPIISTAVGSIPELFDDSSCKFVAPTHESIAEALILLSGGGLDLKQMSSQSQQIFETKLSLEKFLNSYAKVLAG